MENEKPLAGETGAETEPIGWKARARANTSAKVKLAFYIHLAAFIFVNLLLAMINAMTTPQYWWVTWSLMGWGFALLIHALVSFLLPDLFGVKQRLYEQELARQKGK